MAQTDSEKLVREEEEEAEKQGNSVVCCRLTAKSVVYSIVTFTIMFVVLFCIVVFSVPGYYATSLTRNDAPVIGLLAQETKYAPPNMTSYIAASYVKYLESGGARVVPIMINRPVEEYNTLFNSINGLLIPGGGANLFTSGYARAAKVFYDLAIQANLKGDFFPIWGTCLGFEQLTVLTSGENLLTRTDDTDGVALPLIFTNETKGSRLFKEFPDDLMAALTSQPLTENSHKWSVTTESHNGNEQLEQFYKVLSTNMAGEVEFVSTFEAYNFPIYGTQWHPEKNAFEWTRPFIPHSPYAVKLTFYMADFFVSEAKKNFHQFSSEEELQKALIYNYSPVYTGKDNSVFEQKYFF